MRGHWTPSTWGEAVDIRVYIRQSNVAKSAMPLPVPLEKVSGTVAMPTNARCGEATFGRHRVDKVAQVSRKWLVHVWAFKFSEKT
jgi:hypothetical protein